MIPHEFPAAARGADRRGLFTRVTLAALLIATAGSVASAQARRGGASGGGTNSNGPAMISPGRPGPSAAPAPRMSAPAPGPHITMVGPGPRMSAPSRPSMPMSRPTVTGSVGRAPSWTITAPRATHATAGPRSAPPVTFSPPATRSAPPVSSVPVVPRATPAMPKATVGVPRPTIGVPQSGDRPVTRTVIPSSPASPPVTTAHPPVVSSSGGRAATPTVITPPIHRAGPSDTTGGAKIDPIARSGSRGVITRSTGGGSSGATNGNGGNGGSSHNSGGHSGGVVASGPRTGGINGVPITTPGGSTVQSHRGTPVGLTGSFDRPLNAGRSGGDNRGRGGDDNRSRGGDGHWGRGWDDHHGHDGHDWDHHHDHDFHSSFFLNVGVGFGIGSFCYAAPPWPFHSCFSYYNYSCGLPYAYYTPSWTVPFVYYDPWWHNSCWSGFYVSAYDPCAPRWWWRPSFVYYDYPCGTYASFRYCRNSCDWLDTYRFGDTTCPAVSTCALVPSCSTAGGWTWSTNGVYKYGWFPSGTVTSISAVSGEPSIAETQLPPPATARELLGNSDRELADTYMRLGDLPNAERVYSNHLNAYPGDVQAQRSLGLALMASGRVQEGAEKLELSYRIDPTLAANPIPTDLLTGQDQVQRLTDEATRLAATNPSPAAWLSVAALMQAQNQPGPARAALDKAKSAGLAGEVVESMQAALPVPQE